MSQKHPFLEASEDLRTSYLVVLGAITTADKENSEEEVAFMEQMSIAAELSGDNKERVKNSLKNTKSVNLSKELKDFEGDDLRFSLMADVLNLVYADGDLDKNEVKQLEKVQTTLEISEEQYDALQKYVKAANKAAEKKAGNPNIKKKGEEEGTNFLEASGMNNMFKQLGIPVDNFSNGSTIGTALTGTAFFLLQNYVKGNTKGENSLGDKIGDFVGSMFTTKESKKDQTGGMGNLVAGFFSSDAGKATINNVLGNVVDSMAEGKGIGNLSSIIGGKNAQAGLQGVLGALMGGGK